MAGEILDFNGHDGTEGQKNDFLGTRLDHDAARRHVWGFFGVHSQAARDDYESGAPATGTGAFLAALSVTAALAAVGIGAW